MPVDIEQITDNRADGYFDESGRVVNKLLDFAILKTLLPNLIGEKISPKGETRILKVLLSEDINTSKVIVGIPNHKHREKIRFKDILNADKIIIFYLKNHQYPVSNTQNRMKCDFRNPNPVIKVPPVQCNSYAPRIAELIRKKLKEKKI